jgi:hypothetical protein
MAAIFNFSPGDCALMIPGAVNGNPALVAPTALIKDRRETGIGKVPSWISPQDVESLSDTAPIFAPAGGVCKSLGRKRSSSHPVEEARVIKRVGIDVS